MAANKAEETLQKAQTSGADVLMLQDPRLDLIGIIGA